MDTNTKIDIVSVFEVVIDIAKHCVGDISDDDLRKSIENNEKLLKNSQRRVAAVALKELLVGLGEDDKDE